MARTEWEMALAGVVAENVKRLRGEAGISQERLARRMEMTKQTVFDIEHAVRLADWTTYGRLADALGVPVSAVLPLDRSSLESIGRHIANTPVKRKSRESFSRRSTSRSRAA